MEEDNQLRRGQRDRKLTEKGAEFTLETKFKNRERCFKILSTLSDNLHKLLLTEKDKDIVKSAYSEWLDKYEEFLLSHDEVQAWLSQSDQISDEESFRKRDEKLMMLKESVEEWFLKHSKVVSMDKKSVISGKSFDSKSSYSLAKLEENQRKVELLARAEALHEKKQIEEAKLQLKIKEEELDIQTALKISDARTKIIEELERTELREKQLTEALSDIQLELDQQPPMFVPVTKTTVSQPPVSVLHSDLNPHAPLFTSQTMSRSTAQQNWNTPVPTPIISRNGPINVTSSTPHSIPYIPPTTQHSTPYAPAISTYSEIYHSGCGQNDGSSVYTPHVHFCNPPPPINSESYSHVDGLLNVAREMNKPKAEIQKFEGNPMDYQRFIRQFNTKVCANTNSYEERLNFLLQFTSGEANRIVTGYSHLNAESGYKAALDEFKDRYGDPDVIAQAYVKRALNWQTVKQDNTRALDDFAIFLTECQYAVYNVDSARVLEYSENMKLLIRKLPFYLQEKWRNIVYELKDRKQTVKFENLVNFVRKEAKKANDPIYGREVMNSLTPAKQAQNEKSVTFSRQKKNFSTKTVEPDSSSSQHSSGESPKQKPIASVKTCIYCNGTSHALEECRNIMKLSLKGRYEVLKSKGLCFGCLKSGHLKSACQHKSYCTYCKRCHPSILHLDPRQSKESETSTIGRPDQNNNSLPISSSAIT